MTPRRLQQFRIEPGRIYAYSVSGGAEKAGDATADELGHLTIDGVPITKTGVRFRVWTK